MELGWSWWLGHRGMKWGGVCSALQQPHHKVTVLGATRHYLMWILVRIELREGTKKSGYDMSYYGIGFICAFLWGLCVYSLTLLAIENKEAWEQAKQLKNWSDSSWFKEWADPSLKLKRSNPCPSVR